MLPLLWLIVPVSLLQALSQGSSRTCFRVVYQFNTAVELRKAQNQAMLKKVLCLIMLHDEC